MWPSHLIYHVTWNPHIHHMTLHVTWITWPFTWYFNLVIWDNKSSVVSTGLAWEYRTRIGIDMTLWPNGDIKSSFLNLKLWTILIYSRLFLEWIIWPTHWNEKLWQLGRPRRSLMVVTEGPADLTKSPLEKRLPLSNSPLKFTPKQWTAMNRNTPLTLNT